MKKLLVEYIDDKFINNIALSLTPFCDKLVTNLQSQLYKLYYEYNCSDIIFIDIFLSDEKYQFIEEFGKKINIYIYITDKDSFINKDIKSEYIAALICKEKFNTNHKLITLPVMVNNAIFNKNNTSNKNNDIICFIENIQSLPQELSKFLYPSTTLPIKMFNNNNIIHPQNLGLLSEIDKAKLLQQSKYYLAITEDYIPEAWSCKCCVLSTDDLDSLKPTKFKYSSSFQSYSNFLKGLLSEK